MKDVLIFLLFVLLAFPFGAGFAAFLRWLSKQKRDAPIRQALADSWFMLDAFGLPFNLVIAAVDAVNHNSDQVKSHLLQAGIFAVAFLGAWAETRRFQRRR